MKVRTTVLLWQEVTKGIEVLSARGPIGERDASTLVDAVERLLALEPRAVLLDLRQATSITPAAQVRLNALNGLRGEWPRAALLVCLPPDTRIEGVATVLDLDEALTRVDDRPPRARSRVQVEHNAHGPAQARAAVAECCSRMGLEHLRDDLSLIVSEMVTNAVRHAEPPVSMEIEADDEAVVVSVHDGSPGRPRPREADHDAEGGRGLMLVDVLCSDHGVRPQPPGKSVWARLERSGSSS